MGDAGSRPAAWSRLIILLVALDDREREEDKEEEDEDGSPRIGGEEPRMMTVGPATGDVGRAIGPCLLARTAACKPGNHVGT